MRDTYRSDIEAQKIQGFNFEDFGPPEATMPLNRGLKNPRSSFFEDFGPLEATMPLNRGLKSPRHSTFEEFDTPEATMPLNGGLKCPRSSIFEDVQQLQFSGLEPKRMPCVQGWAGARPGPSAHVILGWFYKTCLSL